MGLDLRLHVRAIHIAALMDEMRLAHDRDAQASNLLNEFVGRDGGMLDPISRPHARLFERREREDEFDLGRAVDRDRARRSMGVRDERARAVQSGQARFMEVELGGP